MSWSCAVSCPACLLVLFLCCVVNCWPPYSLFCAVWCQAGLHVLIQCCVVPCWPACIGPVPCVALLAYVYWYCAVWSPDSLHVLFLCCEVYCWPACPIFVCGVPCWTQCPCPVPCGALLASMSWSSAVWCPAGHHVLVLCLVVPCCPTCIGPVLCGVLLASKSWSCAVWCPAGLHVLSHVPCGALLSCVSLVLCLVVPCLPCILVLCCVVSCWPACPDLGPCSTLLDTVSCSCAMGCPSGQHVLVL